MHILITGAAGMIGRKLTAKLVKDGGLNGKSIERLTLIDVVAPEKPAGFSGTVELSASDLSGPGVAAKTVAGKPDVIFHLAGVVSGEAETDFEKGYRVNLDGTRALLEAIRAAAYRPKIVFTSSIAVYGAPFPKSIPDDFHLTPLTSYGTQKAICELLLADYSGAACSMASGSGCRQSACGPASPTRQRPVSFQALSGNRSPARRRSCRSPKVYGIHMRARAPRSTFSSTPRA